MHHNSKLKKLKEYFFLILILAFAFILQLKFFIGYTIHPSDEAIILKNSLLALRGEFTKILQNYKNVPKNGLYDPSEIFTFRPLMFLPITFFWLIFGINDLSTVLWPIISFHGIIITTFLIGKTIFNKKVALISAFLVSIFPLNLLYSTRVSIDIPLTFFMSLSVLFFLKGTLNLTKKSTKKYFILSGVFLFLAYLVKITAIVLFGVYSLYILLYKRKATVRYLPLFIIFLIGFLVECLFYYSISGHFFLRHMVNKGLLLNKHLNEPSINITITTFLRLFYTESEPIFYLKYMFGGNVPIEYEYPHVEFFYFFVFLGIIILFLNKEKNVNFLIMWFLILLIWLEFGVARIEIKNGKINYWVIQKHDRYMIILSVPSVLILGRILSNLKKEITIIIILILFVTSIQTVNVSSSILKDVKDDVRKAYLFLKDKPTLKTYCDYTCVSFLDFYFEYKNTKNLHIIPLEEEELKKIRNAYAIINGSRTVGLCCIEELQPKRIPERWIEIFTIDKEINEWRKSKLKIYYIP